jgi:hypothetical protein
MRETLPGDDGWSEELRATHLALSAEDLKFRELARQDQDFLRRSTFHILDSDLRLQYRQQPWPTFIGRAKLGQLESLTLALASLIRSVPQRIFHNDAAKICSFYGLPSHAAADIILSEPNCIEDSMGRADLIDTADGFKCIEFNFTPNVGGWETGLLAEMQRKVPEVSLFLEREKIRFKYTSTLRVLFQHVLRQADRWRLCERGELNVACAFVPASLDEPGLRQAMELFQHELEQACQDAGASLRGQVIACHYGQLVPVQGKLFYGRKEVHAVLELCLDLAPTPVYRSFKAGKVLLFNGPITAVLSNKLNIALLSESQESSAFSPEERDVIRKHVPWTRQVTAERVRFRGEEAFLPDLLISERDRLVLKEGRNFGGKGVHLGRFTSAARWEEVSRRALETGGWVVQELLESLPYLYQCGEVGCAPHNVIWGPFVFGSLYGGVILRMQPQAAASGAVNASLAATEGIVLEV